MESSGSQRRVHKQWYQRRVHGDYKMGNTAGSVPVTYNDQIIRELAQTSGLCDSEIREECTYWLKKHPNGKMYKEDLKEMMSKALAGISEEDVAKIETHLFRIYDENQNGLLISTSS
eukprot:TRINITY_DN12743_c0_g1_i2.p1 TRINITY_DN12743_c0_g1~~TRINITY_DN12743_c0_g1_i2.p1  ORF type:complete len:117 (-),score=51.62 TRINITY_DN12743_c0_g1_i2:441-791(-)